MIQLVRKLPIQSALAEGLARVNTENKKLLWAAAGLLFAGLLWAAQCRLIRYERAQNAVAGRVSEDGPDDVARNASRRDGGGRSQVEERAMSDAARRVPYSMSGPEFLTDPALSAAIAVKAGDVSGDGRDDLVFLATRFGATMKDDRMQVLVAYQREDGRLANAVPVAEIGSALSHELLIADLDRDGVQDIVGANGRVVTFLRANPDQSFTPSTAVVDDPRNLLATDVDRDGRLDVLVDSHDDHATVLHGDGRGGIDHVSTIGLPASAVRTTGDLTGDGLDDLVLATIVDRPLQEFRIYRALATGGYAEPLILYRPKEQNHASSAAVGDFNADGLADIALDEARDGGPVHVFYQTAGGAFDPGLDIPRYNGSGLLLATDLDGDGRTDLAMAHSGWGYIGYFLQTTAGFNPEVRVDAYQYMGRWNYFAAGDVNHDGCTDLITSRESQSPVVVYGQNCMKRMESPECRYPAMVAANPTPSPSSLNSAATARQTIGVSAATELSRIGRARSKISTPARR